ncbi:MAG: dipeptidase [Lachnospiraceae bacterium]|nr:dipeptidase [Lachnospiraceae bacterium]
MKVVDMHCDTISEIWYSRDNIGESEYDDLGGPQELRKNRLQIDIERMEKGDYFMQNFAMFVNMNNGLDPLECALKLIDIFYEEMEKNADKILPVKCWADIEEARRSGKMAAMITLEEGQVTKGNLQYLRDLYRLGARMMTLTWNHENDLAYPNLVSKDPRTVYPFHPVEDHGLKEKGIELVEECERIGMILDVSHLSDGGFYDLYEHTKKPFVASHSNARAVCGHCRNLTDDMIRKIGERGGVIGLNYCASFLEEGETKEACRSRVSFMARHARHITNVGGMDCLGLGSDFDGISGNLEMDECSKLPMLEAALMLEGFRESEIEKIFNGNVLRLYRELL